MTLQKPVKVKELSTRVQVKAVFCAVMSQSKNICPPKNPPTSFHQRFTVHVEGPARFAYDRDKLFHAQPNFLSCLVRRVIPEQAWFDFVRSERRFEVLKAKKELIEKHAERKKFPSLCKVSRRFILARVAHQTRRKEVGQMYLDCSTQRVNSRGEYYLKKHIFTSFQI